ncbi:MlaD family protein [Pseudonocardia sp. Cha107L01]|uniref:MlaD family protein n=1 Tax=Pseudonocardia sp. Cha107L01 TaxID=3457576 RepID=UPI00403E7DB8
MAVKPESRVMARSFQVGIGGVLLIALLTYLTFAAQYGNPFSSKNYIKAVFHDIHALQVKDPVRQNSKGIGRVSDISYENGNAVVTMQIELGGDYHAYKDATAYIGDTSAVGAKFIGISPGHSESGPLPDDTIPITQTHDSQDLYHVLNIFDPTTRTATQTFLQNFGGGMGGHSDGFRDFMHNAPADLNGLGTVSDDLASKQADLPALLRSADSLAASLQGRERDIASLIQQTDTTFSSIAVDNAVPLSTVLHKAPATLDDVRTATDALSDPLADTQQAMTDLRHGADSLGRSDDDLKGSFRDGTPVLDKVPDVADQTSPAFDDLKPTFGDLQPLAPRLTEFFNRFATPLQVLAPYSKEMGELFVRGRSFVSEGTANGVHYARLNADVQGPYSVTGGVVKACHFQADPYPKPGQADRDHLGLLNEVPCGVQARGLGGK